MENQNPVPSNSKARWLRLATVLELGVIIIAFVLGSVFSIDPFAHLTYDLTAILWGVWGTVPLYWLLTASYKTRIVGCRDIQKWLVDTFGPFLSACTPLERWYLGFLAGISEETLFRGVLQPWLEQDWGSWGALIFSNMVFGLLHWVTPLYGLLAGLTGTYLGISLDVSGERNLLTPILIHALYDVIAFSAVVRMYRFAQSISTDGS